MKRKIFAWVLFSVVFLVASGASLAVMPSPTEKVNTKSHNQKVVTIPDTAVQVATNVYSLGSTHDQGTGKVVDGFMIVHRKQGNAKGPGKPGGTTPCYGFLAAGAKWKTLEPWMVNATNSEGLASTDVFSILDQGINKWEDATDGVIGLASGSVLGDGAPTTDILEANTTATDDKNEVYFGSIAESGTIAVTIVWGVFGGPPASRQLVEWDMVFDEVDFSWSTTEIGDPSAMDFESLATHELGHAVGLADLYNSCVNETMYGYASNGETKKRDLNTGDIQGMNSLY